MKRAEDSPEVGGPCYTLYLEYLGGLVPILKGRRISKLRPEFVIMDPKTDSKAGESFNEWSSEEAAAARLFSPSLRLPAPKDIDFPFFAACLTAINYCPKCF